MVTPEEMQAAQVITGVAIAAFLLAPRIGRDPRRIRSAVLLLYLVAAAVLVGRVLLR
jgi:hypothetical protein